MRKTPFDNLRLFPLAAFRRRSTAHGGVLLELAVVLLLFVLILLPGVPNMVGMMSEHARMIYVARMAARHAASNPLLGQRALENGLSLEDELSTHAGNLARAYSDAVGLDSANILVNVESIPVAGNDYARFLKVTVSRRRFNFFGRFGMKLCVRSVFPILLSGWTGDGIVFGDRSEPSPPLDATRVIVDTEC